MAKYGLNQVTLIGNLGKDPEVKYLDQGVALASLWMACTERFRDKNGNYVDRTEWVSVNLWRAQAEIAGKYCRKGSTVCIEGRLITRSWETPQGEKRSRTEVEGRRIILLDSAPSALGEPLAQPVLGERSTQTPQGANVSNPASPAPTNPTPQGNTPGIESENTNREDLDDLPF
ncbi:MAG: single-stranded DNA-binding protein [Bacteroidota bacterium]